MATPNYPKGLHAYEECSGVGACDRSTGICNCIDGYSGTGCRRATCPNDCSGNGICVKSSEVAPDGYGANNLLQYQKMYWDHDKSTQCLCDPGFIGIDCSVRICPESSMVEATCDGGMSSHNDIQAITVSFEKSFATMATVEFDNYFSLQFTDAFNGKTTTRPINFWDDALVVQQALYALPSYALTNIKVAKIWPLQDYTESSDSDSYTAGSTLETDGTFRNLACETWFYDAFKDSSCTLDSDCETKFGLDAGVTVVCETDLGICVETSGSDCLVTDGMDEFVTDECASSFTPDGIYQSVSIGGSFWGRRLGFFERKCNVGLFEVDDPAFAVPCTTDADCVSCGPNTQVTAGECDSGGNVCVPSTDFTSTYVTAELEECSVAAFVISFDPGVGGSRKNLFSCQIGDNTNAPGASPRFESSALSTCSALHVGLPEWRTSPKSSGLNDLCWSRDASTGVAVNEFVHEDDVAAYEAAGGFCFDLDSGTASELNLIVEDQNANHAKLVGQSNGLSWPGLTLFSDNAITDLVDMDYVTDLPCSNAGVCEETSGLCLCASTNTGAACEELIAFV
eukprot:INCI15396.1.p1 GENE.INCI15396.1~~INCI15396.1.p1  ORF type:complete len:568 (-),score=94.63 INCI15396.1:1949-3652(-)